MTDRMMTLAAIENLCLQALMAAGASEDNAAAVARSTVLAERDGIRSHGLLYLPIYAEHVRCGKVDGVARPVVTQPRSGAIVVDAATGFRSSGDRRGLGPFHRRSARKCRGGNDGVQLLQLRRSSAITPSASPRRACSGLCTTHAPASIAPPSGRVPVIGTNPFALGVPDGAGGGGARARPVGERGGEIGNSSARTGGAVDRAGLGASMRTWR
jgi:(2R)-3-sulfolactate dehydrogenase (NADP+)